MLIFYLHLLYNIQYIRLQFSNSKNMNNIVLHEDILMFMTSLYYCSVIILQNLDYCEFKISTSSIRCLSDILLSHKKIGPDRCIVEIHVVDTVDVIYDDTYNADHYHHLLTIHHKWPFYSPDD